MLVILFQYLSHLPLRLLHGLGSAIGWLVYGLSGSMRRRMRDYLTLARHPDSLNASVSEMGKMFTELPFVWCADPERVKAHVRVENWALVQSALDAGKGVIFLTPHLGCFEATAQMIALQTPLTVMYRPPRKAALAPLLEDARARHNLGLAPANLKGVRILAKVLKQGGAIGILPDQVPQEGEGIWADFFGKPAYTMTLPARLQEMTGAAVILTYAERLPRGAGFVVHFVAFDENLQGDVAQRAGAINRAMECLIARSPAQYLWSYNRYKAPKGTAPVRQEAA